MKQQIKKYFVGKKILVTGFRGYVGSSLAQLISEFDCNLTLLDVVSLGWCPSSSEANIEVVQGDVTEPNTWSSVLEGVDCVFHLAALEYDRSNFDVIKDWKINALSVLNLVEACRVSGIRPKIVFASSANIFGAVDELPVNENTRDNPASLWSVHKLTAENYLRTYAQRYGVGSIVLRLPNVYGASACLSVADRAIVNNAIIQALAGKAIRVFRNSGCKRDYMYVGDVAMALLSASICESMPQKGEFYVIGGESVMTFEDLWNIIANKVGAVTGKRVSVEQDKSVTLEPLDMRDFVADTSKFCGLTGWTPKVLLEKGIEETIDAFKNMP